jgi:hypothetical protein
MSEANSARAIPLVNPGRREDGKEFTMDFQGTPSFSDGGLLFAEMGDSILDCRPELRNSFRLWYPGKENRGFITSKLGEE